MPFPFQAADVPESLRWAHPVVQEWFVAKFGTPTEPQDQGWPHILARRTTLISAPTGSGKTLAAFLACIDRLVRKALDGDLSDRTEVVYVSPLKALGNDIQKNLEGPLREITQLAAERGLLMPAIRTMVRTGDTLAAERRMMLKRPPHILVTTPESLYILLTAEKSRAILRDVETVIVDEIHAVADDKRGAHLALSLERLELLCKKRPVRIGLSATQKPIELVAQFLTGIDSRRAEPVIVNVGHKRQVDLAVELPKGELGAVTSNVMWDDIFELLECAALVRSIHKGELDRLYIPDCPLDILSQQIVAMCASQKSSENGDLDTDTWNEDDLLRVLHRAYPYRDLKDKDYQAVLEMLSEGIASKRGRYGAYIHRDQVNKRLRARRGARMTAITNGGAIPDTALYTVIAEPEGHVVGTVHEDFAVEISRGEIMQLGNTSWRIRRVESSGRMFVEDAHGAAPTIPFWLGEAPSRTMELSAEIAEIRQTISDMTRN